jgi:histidinol-phosphate aminotransferase
MAGKVVVVTGSTSGIGRAVALGYGARGAFIVLNGLSRERLSAAVEAAQARGLRVVGVRADAASPSGARRLLRRAYEVFGRVDILVNNAGRSGPPPAPFWRLKPADWSRTMAANLKGPILCSSAYVRELQRRGGTTGRIINVSSLAGTCAYRGLGPYCASKFGLRGFTECQALDLEGTGIVVCCLELASHRTPMTRRRFPREEYEALPPPEDVLDLFLYAATGPAGLLHGRTLSESRFRADPHAEARLAGPLATVGPWSPHMARYASDRPVVPGALHLDFLENPQGPPDSAHDAIRRTGKAAIARYPDPRLTSLRRALAGRLELPEESFTFGNGSTELVQRILRTFTRPGDAVLSTDPTWPVFERFCRALGLDLCQAAYTIDRQEGIARLDFDDLLSAVGPRTRLIYLVNPNNPLGAVLPESGFLRFLDQLPPDIPVVVDEAYIEYAERSDMIRLNQLARANSRPLIGVRTFSKFFGLAGMRVGYAYGAPETTRLIARLELPFAISGAAESAAVAALNDGPHAAATLAAVRRGRAQVRERLARSGLFTLESEASFVMAEVT